MAGEGHMSQVGSTLRENKKNMLDRKRLFKNKQSFTGSSIPLKFNNVSEEALELLKEKIRIKIKKEEKKQKVVTLVIIFLIVLVFYYLFSDFYIDFKMFSRFRQFNN